MATYKGIGYDSTNGKNRTGAATDTISFNTGVNIDGNLEVVGNIISRDEERVLVQDNFLDINFGYTTNAPLEGGLAANYDPTTTGRTINSTATNITFAAVSGATRPKLSVALAQLPNSTFADGDIIQIAGTTNAENDGFYVVHSQTSGADPAVLEVKSTLISGSADTINAKFAQVNFTGEVESASASVTIFKINVAALQVSTTGAWQVANGNADSAFSTFTNLGISTLQQAYDAGSSITTDASGAITFTLSADNQGLSVQGGSGGTGEVSIGGTTAIDSFVVGASGAASSITSTGQNLTLQTATSGALTLTSAAAATWSTAAGVLTIDGAAGLTMDSDGTDPVNLGTEAVAKTITVGNVASAEVEINAIRVDINAVANGFQIDGAGASNVSTSGGGTLTLSSDGILAMDTVGTDAINLGVEAAAKTITIGNDASTKVDVNALAIELDSAGTLVQTSVAATTITAGAASTWSSSAGALTLTSAAAATWSTAAGILSLTGAGGVTVTSTGGTLTLDGTGRTVDLNATGLDIDDAGATALNSQTITMTTAAAQANAFKLVSNTDDIIHMDNTAGVSVSFKNCDIVVDAQGTGTQIATNLNVLNGVVEGNPLYIKATGELDKADADAIGTAQVIGIAIDANGGGGAATKKVMCAQGQIALAKFDSAPGGGDRGKAVYVSTTAGDVSLTPPSAASDVIYRVGFLYDHNSVGGLYQIIFQPQFIMELG